MTTSAKVALFYQLIELWYCSAVWLSQSIRQGQVLRVCVEQSSLPQQTGGWSPRSITICLCTRLRRLARLASLSSNTWISVIRTFWADVTDSIRSYEFHRLGCFHYTKRCINYCTLSRNHCQYCSVVITFLCLAGHTGFEPVRRFLNDGLANRSRNHLSNVPELFGSSTGIRTQMNQLSVAYGI